jgi:hypothetical protein
MFSGDMPIFLLSFVGPAGFEFQKWVGFEVMGGPQVRIGWFMAPFWIFSIYKWMRTGGTPNLTTPPFFFPLRFFFREACNANPSDRMSSGAPWTKKTPFFASQGSSRGW